MITTAIFVFCIFTGAFFLFIAALGIIRLPDAFCRMHASTKAASLGIGFQVVAAAVYFGEMAVSTKALMIVVFILLTAPVAGHLMARATQLRIDRDRTWQKDA